MRRLVTIAGFIASGLLSVVCSSARAEDSSPITDRFSLRAIFLDPSVSSEVRLDTGTGATAITGTLISGENDFGLASKPAQGGIELMFRLRERSRLRFDYFSVDRSGDELLNRTIRFGDDLYAIGDRATSDLDWRSMRFTYTYSFIRTDRFEVGFGAGVDVIHVTANARVRARSIGEEATGAGAFPTIALDSTWAVSKRWDFNLRGQYFGATVGDFSGSLANYHADIQYRWRKNFQFGLGYTINRVIVEIADKDFPGRFALNARGPEAFVRASF